MDKHKINLQAGFKYIKELRPFITPNEGFKLQLAQFEIEKFGNSTIDKVPEWQFYGWRSIRHKVVINDDANSSDNCCNIS